MAIDKETRRRERMDYDMSVFAQKGTVTWCDTTVKIVRVQMKRSTSQSPNSAKKKLKTSESEDITLSDNRDGDGWTKVERRKSKKLRKLEGVSSVCTFIHFYRNLKAM